MKLRDRVAVITGAGSGIGRSTAHLFAEQGAKVVIADLKLEAAQETCEMIRKSGGECFPVQVNVSKADEVQRMYEETLRQFGKLDIVYNNAGVPLSPHNIEDITEEIFDHIFNVNVKGVIWGCKYAVPIFKMQKSGGVIINTASISASRPRAGQNVYAASKSAVVTLTKSLAMELADYQIRVVAINPVAVNTPMLKGFIGERDEQEAKKMYISSIPLGRLAEPKDIANAALYLASDDASLVTGSILDVDGGRGI
ncbi:SDR family oxidoreductase [Paenibacillus filicis]|uniref:SDR family oxidoreductase n=1 Tax=Paenibacillus gyeongsangnamensis TaxID=3388067 RepID=A0ABT4Q3U5_9BACL|nr:SDR family oxidoreductase [Paenibacillus filicis]MCZ8511517.1 SDR family oxidoreductase [Paenibacillus filicis]